jgi:hypothetical protein
VEGKQVGVWAAVLAYLWRGNRRQQRSNRLGKVVKVEVIRFENPRHRSPSLRFQGRRRIVECLDIRSLIAAAVSHGRVVSTPTTISAMRPICCLVSSWNYIRGRLEKCPPVAVGLLRWALEVEQRLVVWQHNSKGHEFVIHQIPSLSQSADTVPIL